MATAVEECALTTSQSCAANAEETENLSDQCRDPPVGRKELDTMASAELGESSKAQQLNRHGSKQSPENSGRGDAVENGSKEPCQPEAQENDKQRDFSSEASAESYSDVDGESGDVPIEPGETRVPPPSLSEADIIRRMGAILLPDQAGVAGFSVRKSNLQRMRLLDTEAPEPDNLLPYQHYSRSDVLQEIQKLGKESDWTEHKTALRACPLDEILLIRDVSGLYGSNYAWIFTEIAYEATKTHIEELRQKVLREHQRAIAEEERKRQRKQRLLERQNAPPMCFFAKQWKSEKEAVTHAQIKQLSLQTRRPLMSRLITRDSRFLRQPAKFQPFSDKVHSQRPEKSNVFLPIKKEVDFAVQAVTPVEDADAQTILCIPKNACTQHDDSDELEQPILSKKKSKAFSEFFSRVEGLVEEALEQNETTNVFVDTFSQLQEGELSHFQDSRQGVRELLSFNDLNFSKGKIVSCIRWHPKDDSVICYTCVENSTFDERIERSGRPVQAYLLMWHFGDIITPQAIFSSPADPIAFTMCEVEDEHYVVAGLITGQIKKSTKVAQNASTPAKYVVSGSGDDQIFVWDIASAVQSSDTEDYQWRPLLQIPLRRQEGGADMGCSHLLIQKRDGPPATTLFWALTEEGEVVRGDLGHAMDEKKTDYAQDVYTDIALIVMDLGFHIWSLDLSKPIYSSPTPAVFYSCGVWSSTRPAVFYVGCVDGTLEVWDLSEQSRACSVSFVVAASAVTYLAFPPNPHSKHEAGPSIVKQPLPSGEARDDEEWLRRKKEASCGLLAVGDGSGVVHIVSLPKNLTEAVCLCSTLLHVKQGEFFSPSIEMQVHGEYGMVKQLFAREKDVVSYVVGRRDTLRKERDLVCKKRSANGVEHSDDDQAQPAPTTNEAELAAMEQGYRELEAAYRKDLRLAESDSQVAEQKNEANRRCTLEKNVAVRLASIGN